MKYYLFCDESGDKAVPIRKGSSLVYVVTLIIVSDNEIESLRNDINNSRRTILKLRKPLEWKKLDKNVKENDLLLYEFFKNINLAAHHSLISTLIANKSEIDTSLSKGLIQPNIFMNYLYSLLFKRVNPFLHTFSINADFYIDRNTNLISHKEFELYLCHIFPKKQGLNANYSKPIFITPAQDPCLQLSDFISGYIRRVFEHYLANQYHKCSICPYMTTDCLQNCPDDSFIYKKSWFELKKKYNFRVFNQNKEWFWHGLLYFPLNP
ncbi:MAG: DUF3800 domain-containing protein [Firmicutes bacterium]|nr:DUF3800 domain-containing protein [Bacillota bacterium]